MKKASKSLKYVYLALMLFFLYMPIIYLIVFSFNDFWSTAQKRDIYINLGQFKGFTLRNYGKLFTGEAGSALLLTLEIAGISSVVATVIGTAAAIGINVMKKRSRNVILNISQLPMVNPDLVTGITFMMLFAFVNSALVSLGMKQVNDIIKLLIAHISFSIPYVAARLCRRCSRRSSRISCRASAPVSSWRSR